MATVQLTPTTVTVRLTRAEKFWGLLRDVRFDRAAVREADVVQDPLSAARGLRAPGLALPGRRKIGTWRRRGERSLVSVRRGVPAVRLRLDGARYDTVLISTDDAAALAGALA
ncbi:hypothetical protein [Blastococcus litoris]|uniref:hypothetical protein n=1 Tax=Blastococcus litoris TaxID=2171622 RepID=UPI000E305F65|nr:hypothetical protein [Blastococcus litoris]